MAPPPPPPPTGWGGQYRPAYKPGIVPLRPLSMGEIFDGAFQAIRTNPRTMIGFSAVVLTITTLLSTVPQALLLQGLADNALITSASSEPELDDVLDLYSGLIGGSLVPAFITFLATTVLSALLVVAVSGAVLGDRIGPAQLWARTRGRVLAAIGLALLVSFALLAVLGVLLIPGILLLVADQPVAGAVLIVLAVVVWIVAAIWLWASWSLAGPALLLEEQGVLASLRRSMRLVRVSWWRVFGILFLTQIIIGFGSAIVSVPFSLASAVVAALQENPYGSLGLTLVQLLVAGIGQVISGAVFLPFGAAVTALLYTDLRMRREGLDVQLLRAVESNPPPR